MSSALTHTDPPSRTHGLPAFGIAIATMSLLPGKAGNPAALCAENAKEGTGLSMLSLAPSQHMRILSHTALAQGHYNEITETKVLTPGNSQLV